MELTFLRIHVQTVLEQVREDSPDMTNVLPGGTGVNESVSEACG